MNLNMKNLSSTSNCWTFWMSEKFFCPLPWIHQFVQPTGVKICCSSTQELKLTPAEFNESLYLQQVKQTIVLGQVPKECKGCVANEQMGFGSTRQAALKDWHYTIDTVPSQIEYLDLRYNNLCNFSCRTCEPAFSTSIDKEVTLNPVLTKYFKPVVPIYKDIVTSIGKFLPTLKRLNLTGGEPLLIKEHMDVLSALIHSGKTDVELLITTNASVVNPKLLNLISQFDNVHWTVSIDAIGNLAEYIRNGTVWHTVERNLNSILALKQSVFINTTVSAYSVFGLTALANWFKSTKLHYPNQPFEIIFSIVQYPKHLQPGAIPTALLDTALSDIQSCIDILSQDSINPNEHISPLKGLHSYLSSATLQYRDTNKFIDYTKTLDAIRDQSFNKTFNLNL